VHTPSGDVALGEQRDDAPLVDLHVQRLPAHPAVCDLCVCARICVRLCICIRVVELLVDLQV
jgi:hypothetical protein